MLNPEIYGQFETAWCPGCGNHDILRALKMALATLNLPPHKVLLVSGIGQAAKTPHYLRANVFNGLHGRSLPAATGAKLANPELTVIDVSGDGCQYGEGGNHFMAALRRNIDITCLVHDNQVYGLTKGQASPTTPYGQTATAQPRGAASLPFNPLAVAVAHKVGFVARGFSGETEHLRDLIVAGIRHPGFSLIDILQPCVSFNKVNTFAWYKKRCVKLGAEHDPRDFAQAMAKAMEFGERIPIGVISVCDRPSFGEFLPSSSRRPLAENRLDPAALARVMESFA